jgi:hypothetical protein
VRTFLAATLPAATFRLDFLAVPTMQLGFKQCYVFKTYRGRRREAGAPSTVDKTVNGEARKPSALSFTSPALPEHAEDARDHADGR